MCLKKYFKFFLITLIIAILIIFGFFFFENIEKKQKDIVLPTLSKEWKETIKLASGNAFRGPWRMNESIFLYLDDPTVVIAENDEILTLWVDQEKKDIFFQKYNWEGKKIFQEPINISGTPEIFSWLPRMKVSQDGFEIYIVWQEIIFSGGSHGGEILFVRSLDGGKTFSKPINLSNSLAGDGKGRLSQDRWSNGSLDIALDKKNNIFIAWTSYEGDLILRRSFNKGEEFLPPEDITGSNDNPARAPSLAISNDGIIYLIWTYGEANKENIHFAKADEIKNPFILKGPAVIKNGFLDAPRIVIDKLGNLHLVFSWALERFSNQGDIYYSKLNVGEKSFSQPIKISRTTNEWRRFSYPNIVIDNNNIYVLSELFIGQEFRSRGLGLIYWNMKEDNNFNFFVIRDDRKDNLGINGSLQGVLSDKLAINSEGKIVIINSTFNKNNSSHIWLYRSEKISIINL